MWWDVSFFEYYFISPPGFTRQVYVLLLLLSFFFSFLTTAWSKEISETARPSSPNVQGGRYVGVDVQSGIGFATGQGTLPRQPILGAKSAEIGDTPLCSQNTPAVWTEWNAVVADNVAQAADAKIRSLQRGVFSGICALVWRATAELCHAFLVTNLLPSLFERTFEITQHLAKLWGKVDCLKRPVRWGTSC